MLPRERGGCRKKEVSIVFGQPATPETRRGSAQSNHRHQVEGTPRP